MRAKEAWFGFGIDPINQSVVAITIERTKKKAQERCRAVVDTDPKCKDVCNWRVFNLLSMSDGIAFRAWLRACKLSEKEVKHVLNELTKSIGRARQSP